MDKKKLLRVAATLAACLGLGVFTLGGCKTKDHENTDGDDTHVTDTDKNDQNKDDNTPSGGDDNNKDDNTPSGGDDNNKDDNTPPGGETGNDPSKPGDPIVTPPEPEITGPVEGGPTITKYSQAQLETAYVEWTAAANAKWYNVYYSPKGANSWTQLDAPLVRQYKDYYRADAIGLKAGEYDMKVVPVSGEDTEATNYAATAAGITVVAHERAGFAFVKGTSSGAYNDDGTLRDKARVLYVTEATKNSVTMEVLVGKNTETRVGVQNIIAGYSKNTDTRPLAVRFIGNITDPDNMPNGDLYIDGFKAGLTLEGVGADATINGHGVVIKNSSNVEVRNLGFMNCDSKEGDDVGLQQGNDHVWVHNCDMYYGNAGTDADQVKGDGALDTKKSSYVTHSYNHFWDNGKCNLQGMKEETTENRITYHHNWYDHSDSRHPRIRTCTVHIYNNYFDGNAKYGVGVTRGASAFVENNYFRSTARQRPMMSSMQGTDIASVNEKGEFNSTFDEDGGIIKSFNNKIVGDNVVLRVKSLTRDDNTDGKGVDVWEATTRDEKVPSSFVTLQGGTSYNNFDTASDMYEYKVDDPDTAVQKVKKYAGRIDGGDIKYQFDNNTEDGNSKVIDALKAMLTGYKTSIIKIGNVAVSGGSTGGSTGGTTGGETGGESGGNTPTLPAGTIVYMPMDDGVSGTYHGITVAGNSVDLKDSNSDVSKKPVTIDGTKITKGLKLESSTKINFTPSEDITVTVYLSIDNLNVKEGEGEVAAKTATKQGEYYVLTIEVKAGTKYELTKKDTGTIYKVTLAPKA